MRLISYDFETDIPYEYVVVSLKQSVECYCTIQKVVAYPVSLDNDDSYWVLGKYLTESKAKMAIALMRHACLLGESIFQFPFDDDVKQQYEQKFA